MAEKEEKNEEGKEGKASPVKGGKSKLIVIAAVGLLVLLGGGFFAYKKFFTKHDAAPEEEEKHVKTEEKEKGGHGGEKKTKGKEKGGHGEAKKGKEDKDGGASATIILLEPFIVNITQGNDTHYLKVTLSLEVNNAGVSEEINVQTPKIRDILLTLLGSKSFEEIRSIEGKLSLKDEIIARVNAGLTSGEVTAIYFSEFVMQ